MFHPKNKKRRLGKASGDLNPATWEKASLPLKKFPRPPKPVLSDGVGAEKLDPLPPVERSRHAHKNPAE